MQVLGHLVKSLFRAFFRLIFTALLFGAIGGGVVLLVAYESAQQWPPSQLAIAATIAVAVLAAYAGAVTALMVEAVHGLIATAKLAEKEALSTGNIIEHGVKAVEHLKGDS